MVTQSFGGTVTQLVRETLIDVDTRLPIIVSYSHSITGASSCCPVNCSSILIIRNIDFTEIGRVNFGACGNIVPTDIQPFVAGLNEFIVEVRGVRCSCTPSRANRVTVMNRISGTIEFTENPLKPITINNNLVNNILLDLAGRHSTIDGNIQVNSEIPVLAQVSIFADTEEVFTTSKEIVPEDNLIPISIEGLALDEFLAELTGIVKITVEGIPSIERTFIITNMPTEERFPSFRLDAIQILKGVDIDGFETREISARILANNLANPLPFNGVVRFTVIDRDDTTLQPIMIDALFMMQGDEELSIIVNEADFRLVLFNNPMVLVQVLIEGVDFFNKEQAVAIIEAPEPEPEPEPPMPEPEPPMEPPIPEPIPEDEGSNIPAIVAGIAIVAAIGVGAVVANR